MANMEAFPLVLKHKIKKLPSSRGYRFCGSQPCCKSHQAARSCGIVSVVCMWRPVDREAGEFGEWHSCGPGEVDVSSTLQVWVSSHLEREGEKRRKEGREGRMEREEGGKERRRERGREGEGREGEGREGEGREGRMEREEGGREGGREGGCRKGGRKGQDTGRRGRAM